GVRADADHARLRLRPLPRRRHHRADAAAEGGAPHLPERRMPGLPQRRSPRRQRLRRLLARRGFGGRRARRGDRPRGGPLRLPHRAAPQRRADRALLPRRQRRDARRGGLDHGMGPTPAPLHAPGGRRPRRLPRVADGRVPAGPAPAAPAGPPARDPAERVGAAARTVTTDRTPRARNAPAALVFAPGMFMPLSAPTSPVIIRGWP